MAVLDASAIIAVFLDEPGRALVVELLKSQTARLSAANLCEVYDRLMRGEGESRSDVDGRFETLRRVRSLIVVPVDETIAAHAGALRARHYHHTRRDISNADCIALATAHAADEPLVTSDAHLADAAREEEVEVVVVP